MAWANGCGVSRTLCGRKGSYICGIAGWAGHVPKAQRDNFHTFATSLIVATQSRGEHATGFAARMPGKDVVVSKGPVPAEMFVRTPIWKTALGARSLIGHCRWATHGDPKNNENNHPFTAGKWAVVHNGVITMHQYIAGREGVELKTECDSEVILRVFQKGAGKTQDPVAGLQKFVDAVNGFHADYAIALMDKQDGAIRLLRDEARPISIMRIPKLNVVAFASTDVILKRALDQMLGKMDDADRANVVEGIDGWDCERHKIYVLRPTTMDVDHEPIRLKVVENWFQPWQHTNTDEPDMNRIDTDDAIVE